MTAAIQKAQGKREIRTEITQDRVLAELAKIAFGNIEALFDANGNLLPITEVTPDAAAMIARFEAPGIGDDMGRQYLISACGMLYQKQ